jgi:type VI protein secretion system component Hcp
MGRMRGLFCQAAVMLLVAPGIAAAESDVFMCIDGIKGSSADEDFVGCSEIFGVAYSVGVKKGGAADACGLYEVSKTLDASSVPILIRSLRQRRTAEVEFAMRTRGAEPFVFFRLVLSDVVFATVEQRLDAVADVPIEKISMEPVQVNWEFISQDPSGGPGDSVEGGFDCARGEAIRR